MFTEDQIARMDGKQKALFALLTAAETFLTVTNDALEAKHPGRGQENRDMINQGKAHLLISIQAGSGEIKCDLALAEPEFRETISAPEMTLRASIRSVFGDPDAVQIVDRGKLN